MEQTVLHDVLNKPRVKNAADFGLLATKDHEHQMTH